MPKTTTSKWAVREGSFLALILSRSLRLSILTLMSCELEDMIKHKCKQPRLCACSQIHRHTHTQRPSHGRIWVHDTLHTRVRTNTRTHMLGTAITNKSTRAVGEQLLRATEQP